jgi:hypothetical protein
LVESIPFDVALSAVINSHVLVEEVSSFNLEPVNRTSGVSTNADPRISNIICLPHKLVQIYKTCTFS